MKRLLVFLLFSTPLSSQNLSPLPPAPPVGQVLVHDLKDPQSAGFVQYRSVLSPLWVTLTPGMRLPEGALIRVSDSRAQVTLSFPDGSFLRLIGISSLYLDSISRPRPTPPIDMAEPPKWEESSYQTRVLLLSGRWFYSSNPLSPSTFIVNSDVTTSVIQNGSGGGYYLGGQGQMLVRTGIGRFGWRLSPNTNGGINTPRSRPIILEPGQIITMDIYQGFPTVMGVISADNYAEYGLFPPAALEEQPRMGLIQKNGLYYQNQSYVAQNKSPLTSDQINFEGLNSLQNLEFVRREDALAVGIAKTVTNIAVQEAIVAPVLPKAIPLSLLKPIDLADFQIAVPPTNFLVKKEEPKPQAPPTPAVPRVRERVKVQVAAKKPPAQPAPAVIQEPQIDLAAAVAGIKATPPQAAAAPRRPESPAAARVVVTLPPIPAPPAQEAAPILKAAEKKEPLKKYKTPDFFNRDHFTNDPAFQYKKFEAETVEDLMQGDFSRSLFY